MIKVTLIRPEGCSHCDMAKMTLDDLKKEYPEITIEEIDMNSPEGQALVQKYGILSSPGILVNDEFFAFGGATEKQFREKFEQIKSVQ